ncbi:MAG TPA: oxygenase MpaB family protein, partial [Roseiflexaceae bacterium]|nr:oxygenase MpaB family protein [Roseiflexaceae bacterium]
ELLERPLTEAEKQDVFDVFARVGRRMGILGLPATHAEWLPLRQQHLHDDLAPSHYTTDLYRQYRRHLGPLRYRLLLQAQRLVTPPLVRDLLGMDRRSWLRPVLPFYRHTQQLRLGRWARAALLPPAYKAQIDALDQAPVLERKASVHQAV